MDLPAPARPSVTAGKVTAFVAHPDPPRHDPGWGHPEHQGRLPAIARAVYRDMMTLHEPLLEVEARPADQAELLLAHTPRYLDELRRASAEADAAGQSRPFGAKGRVSGASWDAARASVGAALTAVEAIRDGRVRNAFCAARPPGRDAGRDGAAGFSLLNPVAVAARYLRERVGAARVLVVDWGARPPLGTPEILVGDPGVRLISVNEDDLPPVADGAAFAAAQSTALERATATWTPDWVLLAAGFDILAGDPLGTLGVLPDEVHALTVALRGRADDWCAGRLVSVLEGGYAPTATGRAVVQHLRALAGLPPA